MKQNQHKLADFIDKQNMDAPYLLKKRKEADSISSKDISKQPKAGGKDEEEKNKKATKSIKSNQNLEQTKSPTSQNPVKDPIKSILNPNMVSMNNQANLPSYLTINNKSHMNEPAAIFKNYSNPVFNNNMQPVTPTPTIGPMNTFLANTSNMIIQPNLSLAAANPINPINPLGNYVQIPVMIAANRAPTGNWAVLDNLGNLNENMALNNLASNETGFMQGSAPNMQKIFDNNIIIQQGNNSNNNPINPSGNQNLMNNNNPPNNNLMNTYLSSFQEFENKMLNIIQNQNKKLQTIKEDNDRTNQTLNTIKQELNQLKESLKSINDPHLNSASFAPKQGVSEIKEEVTKDVLLKYIYNQNPTDFKYELIVKNMFPKTIYKERYFSFEVLLVDIHTREKVKNSNKIPLDLAIYTSEFPPQIIRKNTLGNNMINWNPENNLFEGEMLFDKVQIRDVSSHFRNGSLFLIVFAKASQNNTFQKEEENERISINYQDIKPLIVEKMIVRAKKLNKQLKLKKKMITKNEENNSEESI